jgi:hypothetical protein
MTAWKNPARSRSGVLRAPSVAGLFHSLAVTKTVPSTKRAAVTLSVILVCMLQAHVGWKRRYSSSHTGKPSPPAITANAIGRQIHGSDTNPIRLSLYRANPALLKAETAWNTPRYAARPHSSSYPSANRSVSKTAVAASKTRLIATTPFTTVWTSPSPVALVSVAAVRRDRRPRRRKTSSPRRDASVMIPNPPTWISARITTSPDVDQYDGVSTMTSPVTHTALVEVNRATINGALPSPARDDGSINRAVPTRTASAKATTTTCAGCRNHGRSSRRRTRESDAVTPRG